LCLNGFRNVVTAGALFRQSGRTAAQRRVSQYSSADEGDLASNSDGDGLSRTSVDSSQENHLPGAALGLTGPGGAPIVYRNSTVTSELDYTSSFSLICILLDTILVSSSR